MCKKLTFSELLLVSHTSYGNLKANCNVRRSPVVDSVLSQIKPLNAELNPICSFLALFGDHHIFHVSR